MTMHYAKHHAIDARFLELAEELSAGCDPDFDVSREDLEREFAEIRLSFRNHE